MVTSVLCIAGLLSAHIDSAQASAISKKKNEAKRIAAQIDATGTKIEQLQEDYLQAEIRLKKLTKTLETTTVDSSKTEERLKSVQDALRTRAIDQFSSPVDDKGLRGSEDLGELERRQVVADLAVAKTSDLEDQLRSTTQDLARKQKRVAAARSEAETTKKLLAKQKTAADALAIKLEALQIKTQGELKTLVVEAEKEAAAAEARAQQRALEKRKKAARDELARRKKAMRDRLGRGVNGGAAGHGDGSLPETPAPRDRSGQPQARILPVEKQSDASLSAEAGIEAAIPVSSSSNGAVQLALAQVGKPYIWGADGPGGFDCSGLMLFAWRAAGKALPHSSRAQYASLRHVSTSQIQPGDLVFFGSPIHHVGMYIGNGQMVEASHRGAPVRVRPYLRRDLVGVGRP